MYGFFYWSALVFAGLIAIVNLLAVRGRANFLFQTEGTILPRPVASWIVATIFVCLATGMAVAATHNAKWLGWDVFVVVLGLEGIRVALLSRAAAGWIKGVVYVFATLVIFVSIADMIRR